MVSPGSQVLFPQTGPQSAEHELVVSPGSHVLFPQTGLQSAEHELGDSPGSHVLFPHVAPGVTPSSPASLMQPAATMPTMHTITNTVTLTLSPLPT